MRYNFIILNMHRNAKENIMSKKGLISSLIVGIVLTLSLGIYTLVSVLGGNGKPSEPAGPTNTTVSVAFRTNDTVEELSNYSADKIVFNLAEGAENPIKLNEETGKYEAVSAGEVSIVITLDKKGNTKTLNVTVYKQGTGSSVQDSYIIASAAHLKEFADLVNSDAANKTIPEYTKLVSDIDLSGENWKPIGGQGNKEYRGTFDGNGYTINNLTISVTASNYENFLALSTTEENRAFLDLGLFGKVNNSTIKNLNMKNATINVAEEIYEIITKSQKPEGAVYDKVVRLTIGTIAGSAYNTYIIGSESYSSVTSRINAFSCSTGGQAHGIGGVVGVSQLVRISGYDVKTNITNNMKDVKATYIGGVFGMAFSSYSIGYTDNEYDALDRTVIDNVKVDFASTLLYSNQARVGGIVGLGQNVGIKNSTVESFKIVDNTARSHIDYTLTRVTSVAGIAADFSSQPLTGEEKNNVDVVAAFVSSIDNVDVKNIDVFMLGGDAAGAVYVLGLLERDPQTITETVTLKDTTVAGNITANSVGGVAWQVSPGASIVWTKSFENPVVNLGIKAHMSGGVAYNNYGKILGFEETVPVEEGSSETKIVRTKIDVKTTGMGAYIRTPNNDSIWKTRESTFIAGVVGVMQTFVSTEGLAEEEAKRLTAEVKGLDVNIVATEGISYAGIAFKALFAEISNVSVNANFTSYNYGEKDNISSTYMVSGGVCEASDELVINNVNVVLSVNKDVNKNLNYGATFFGGLVARYLGVNETENAYLTITNSAVSGDVYFNSSYEYVNLGETRYNVFVAGGLIGIISAKAGGQEYVDAYAITDFTGSVISGNNVSNLKITADFKNEVMGNEAYRVRGIGAIAGVVNVALTADVIDFSSNTITGVEIVARTTAFTYEYYDDNKTTQKIVLGAHKNNSYGASYAWNSSVENKITNPSEMGVTYTEIED